MMVPADADRPEDGISLSLETAGVEKHFVKEGLRNHVLNDISISLRLGEFASLIGPSGCGKSTLLKILAGLVPFDSGQIQVFGEEVKQPRRDVGFMFQHLALLPWRNVLQNVLLPAELNGHDRKDAKGRALHSIEMVGLAGYEGYHLNEISGGMQQRVALARVLMANAKLLLLDEPFSALDELTRENIDMLFMDVCVRTKTAALLVTHSVYEAALMSDTVFVMSQRPARIVDTVRIDIPRPRGKDVMTVPTYLEAVARIRESLMRWEEDASDEVDREPPQSTLRGEALGRVNAPRPVEP